MNKLTLINGRYKGRLDDGRLLCVLPDVFEMNRDHFPETELYNPQEWLSSVDGENCWIEQSKRSVGRPRSGKPHKPRIDATLSQEALDFINWLIGPTGNLSEFLEKQIKTHPHYQEWKQSHAKARE